MLTVDIEELFQIVMYIVLIVGVPVLFVQLYILLKRLNTTLKDVNSISAKAVKVSEDPEAVKTFTKELTSYTANDVIDRQTERLAHGLAQGVLSLVKR